MKIPPSDLLRRLNVRTEYEMRAIRLKLTLAIIEDILKNT